MSLLITVIPNGVNFVILASCLRQAVVSLFTIKIYSFLTHNNCFDISCKLQAKYLQTKIFVTEMYVSPH